MPGVFNLHRMRVEGQSGGCSERRSNREGVEGGAKPKTESVSPRHCFAPCRCQRRRATSGAYEMRPHHCQVGWKVRRVRRLDTTGCARVRPCGDRLRRRCARRIPLDLPVSCNTTIAAQSLAYPFPLQSTLCSCGTGPSFPPWPPRFLRGPPATLCPLTAPVSRIVLVAPFARRQRSRWLSRRKRAMRPPRSS
jgi:hypothetical protein